MIGGSLNSAVAVALSCMLVACGPSEQQLAEEAAAEAKRKAEHEKKLAAEEAEKQIMFERLTTLTDKELRSLLIECQGQLNEEALQEYGLQGAVAVINEYSPLSLKLAAGSKSRPEETRIANFREFVDTRTFSGYYTGLSTSYSFMVIRGGKRHIVDGMCDFSTDLEVKSMGLGYPKLIR